MHNSLTAIPDTHKSLHGEKVIFGLIVQFILEDKPQQEIHKLISFLNALNIPITLGQLGIKEDIDNIISKIASGVELPAEALEKLSFKVSSELIEAAIKKANEFGQHSLNVL